MSAKEIRNLIVETLKKDKSTAAIELDGNYFSGVDIAVNNNESKLQAYRIVVISYPPQKNLA